MSLKKKKMFEMQLEQVENNIFRLNEQQNMLEGQRTTVETLVSMQNASRYTIFLSIHLSTRHNRQPRQEDQDMSHAPDCIGLACFFLGRALLCWDLHVSQVLATGCGVRDGN